MGYSYEQMMQQANLPKRDENKMVVDFKEIFKNSTNQGFPSQTSSYPVVCKDGTKKMQPSSPNAEIMDVCRDNGGTSVIKQTTEEVKLENLLVGGNTLTAEDKFYEMLGIKKTDGTGWGMQSRPMGRILVAVVLVAGYFAYKKFKK